MKILLIEDDEEKISDIIDFLAELYPNSDVRTERSFNGGLRAVASMAASFDVLLLDMSMPSFDQSVQEPSGGTPESYAGREMLAQMKLRGIELPTIVVTMFATFGKEEKRRTFEQLEAELAQKFAPTFCGMVRYNQAQEGWRESLGALINKIVRKK